LADLKPGLAGRLDYRIRVHHELLTHPFEMGLCCWVLRSAHKKTLRSFLIRIRSEILPLT
jgi:hypothetical protein